MTAVSILLSKGVPMADLEDPSPKTDQDAPGEANVAAMYEEIRRLARGFMRSERADHTLAPTALANEAWLRLFGTTTPTFDDGGAFLAAAVTTLRRILVEHGRRRLRQKRGGNRMRADSDTDQIEAPLADERLLALDEALARLSEFDAAKGKLVELRFFGGLSVDEAAVVLGMSPRTAARDWRLARAFLRTQLDAGGLTDELDA